jgi:peptidoglycan DL-endopeptidase CwlO
MPLITNIITATITAYCSCKLCCGPNAKGITASGNKPKANYTIAARRSIPFGSKVFIKGKTFTVEDRLAKKYNSRFDIYFLSHAEAKNFGIKHNQKVIIIYEN